MNLKEKLGVDVSRHWSLYDNDVILVDGLDNIYQAIFNRLSCTFNDMAYFYNSYGSKLYTFFGRPNIQSVLDEIASEVVIRLNNEPRITSTRCEVVKLNTNCVAIHVLALIDETDTFDGNFVFDAVSQKLEYVSSEPVTMQITVGDWQCAYMNERKIKVRRGEEFTINCMVYSKDGRRVPIGRVDYAYRNKIFASKELEYGNASITYSFPTNTAIGNYTIYAYYRGVSKYNNCMTTIIVEVVDKIDTYTQFMEAPLHAYAGQYTNFPVSVTDYNNKNVTSGTVTYSLLLDGNYKLGTTLTADNMFTESLPNVVFANATLVDGMGDPMNDVEINFYIENGYGIEVATRTLLDDTSINYQNNYDPNFYSSIVNSVDGTTVRGGTMNYSYRKAYNIPTTTVLPNETLIHNGGSNEFSASVIDDEGLNVVDGEVAYYIRRCGKCKPFNSKITTTDVYIIDGQIYTSSTVTDEDDMELYKGTVTYDYSNVPIGFTADSNPVNPNAKLGAMIVDSDGNIIDSGSLTTTENNDNTYTTTYISEENITDDDNTVYFEITDDR